MTAVERLLPFLRAVATGQLRYVEVWPVDARALLAALEPPEGPA